MIFFTDKSSLTLTVSNQIMAIAMFIVLVLHQLAQILKWFITLRTTIRIIRNRTIPWPSSIFQEWCVRHVSIHTSLPLGKFINLSTCIVLRTTTSSAVSTFDMLHGIRTGFESFLTTNGTFDCFGSMNLHMHLELILGVEFTKAFMTLVGGGLRGIDAGFASGVSISFKPLIATEARVGLPISTIGTVASHGD